MCDNVQDQWMINGNKTVYGIVNYFPRGHADEMLNLKLANAKVLIGYRKH